MQWYKGKRRRPVVPIANKFQQFISVETDKAGSMVYTCIGRNNAGNTRHVESGHITVTVKGQNLMY